jgi:hypothetical protein
MKKRLIEIMKTLRLYFVSDSYSVEEVDTIYKMALKSGVEPSFILWFEEFKKK